MKAPGRSVNVPDRERERVANLARIRPAEALEPARAISDPYLRCQALAWVARYTERAVDALRLATEAVEAVERGGDAWAAVAGAAWPVRALVDRAQIREADALMLRAVASAARVENPVRRVDALFLLVQAGWDVHGAGLSAAIGALVAAARTGASEKTHGVLRDLALLQARDGRDAAAVLAAIPEGRARREAERRLGLGPYPPPRRFFW